jgi:hypothetical protein
MTADRQIRFAFGIPPTRSPSGSQRHDRGAPSGYIAAPRRGTMPSSPDARPRRHSVTVVGAIDPDSVHAMMRG